MWGNTMIAMQRDNSYINLAQSPNQRFRAHLSLWKESHPSFDQISPGVEIWSNSHQAPKPSAIYQKNGFWS